MAILILGQLESDTRLRVITQCFQPDMLDPAVMHSGYLVDAVPDDTPQQDKRSILYLNPITSEMWYEYAPTVSSEIQRLQALENRAKTADQLYKALDLTTAALGDIQNAKMAQLDEACSNSIIAGFDSDVNGISYHFSCSVAAQSNFQGTDTLFKDGLITTVGWTVINNATGKTERINLDQATFNPIKLKVFQHINSNTSKLRDTLEPEVWAATSNAQVAGINW